MRKEHLQEYRHICGEMRRLEDEREVWMARAERSTRAPSRAPTMRGQHDPMPLIADRLGVIRKQVERLYGRLHDAKTRVEKAIEDLPSIERQVMRARYIEGKCWDAISAETSYSVVQLHRIHRNSLEIVKFRHAKSRKYSGNQSESRK